MAGTQSHAPFTPDAAVFCKPGECQKLWTALQNGGKRREFGNWFQQSTQKLSEKVLNGNLSWKDVTVFVNYMCLSGKIVRAVSKASKDVNVQVSAAYSFAVDTERENGSDELAVGCSYPGKPFPCGIMEANLLSDVMANNHLLTERDAFIRIQEKSVTRGQCFVSATQRRRAHAKRNEHAPNIDNFSDRFSARSQSSVVVNRGDSTATRRCLTAKRTRSDDRVESEMELHSTESRDVEGLKETILNGHDFYERVKRIKQETGLEADLQDSEAHYMVVTEGNEGRPEEDDGETSSLEDDQAMDGSESCLSETDAFMHTASVNHSANDSEEMGANSSGGEDIFSGRDVTPETSGMGQCDLNTEADFTESAGPSPLSATMKTPEGAVEDDVEPPSPNPANGRNVMARWKESGAKSRESPSASAITASDDERVLKASEVRLAEDNENTEPEFSQNVSQEEASQVKSANSETDKMKQKSTGKKAVKKTHEQATIEATGEPAPLTESNEMCDDILAAETISKHLTRAQLVALNELMNKSDEKSSNCCERCAKRESDLESIKKTMGQLLNAKTEMSTKIMSLQDKLSRQQHVGTIAPSPVHVDQPQPVPIKLQPALYQPQPDITPVVSRSFNQPKVLFRDGEIAKETRDAIRANALHRDNFAKRLMFAVFSKEERLGRNVNGKTASGRQKRKLSPTRVNMVKRAVFQEYPEQQTEVEYAWKKCVCSINTALRNELLHHEKQMTDSTVSIPQSTLFHLSS